jgi:hypothetical protein
VDKDSQKKTFINLSSLLDIRVLTILKTLFYTNIGVF